MLFYLLEARLWQLDMISLGCVFNAILFSHSLWLLFVFILSTCWSLLSCSCNASSCVVPARGKSLVPTNLSIAIPEGTYGRIAPRSGFAWKHLIDVGVGVIDRITVVQ